MLEYFCHIASGIWHLHSDIYCISQSGSGSAKNQTSTRYQGCSMEESTRETHSKDGNDKCSAHSFKKKHNRLWQMYLHCFCIIKAILYRGDIVGRAPYHISQAQSSFLLSWNGKMLKKKTPIVQHWHCKVTHRARNLFCCLCSQVKKKQSFPQGKPFRLILEVLHQKLQMDSLIYHVLPAGFPVSLRLLWVLLDIVHMTWRNGTFPPVPKADHTPGAPLRGSVQDKVFHSHPSVCSAISLDNFHGLKCFPQSSHLKQPCTFRPLHVRKLILEGYMVWLFLNRLCFPTAVSTAPVPPFLFEGLSSFFLSFAWRAPGAI